MSEKNIKKSKQSPIPITKKHRNVGAPGAVELSNREAGLTIVGIGASAGRHEALDALNWLSNQMQIHSSTRKSTHVMTDIPSQQVI